MTEQPSTGALTEGTMQHDRVVRVVLLSMAVLAVVIVAVWAIIASGLLVENQALAEFAADLRGLP